MKSAKKLMLLLLSLVLLIGTFAVVALAENDADVATVVYPDGTTETYAVGEAIVPKAFTDGFYEGKGNTLWQGDAWSFTVSGEASALADLKVTDAMKGKTIMASGAKQVYSKIDIHFPEGDYYEYITGSSYKIGDTEYKNAIYVLSGTSGTATHLVLEDGVEVEKTVEYSTTKRVAGDYTVYFYDAASFAKFFSTSCSIELGGVVVDNKDLRTLSDTKITATLYADQTIGNTFNWGKGYDRATNQPKSNSIAQGEGGNAKVYIDLNGHTVVNNSTSTLELTEMQLIMYSSKAGAHFYKEASSTAFYVSDGCTFFIGNNDSNTDTYSDNLSVHAKALFSTMYGSGAYIIGGHYYQTAGATSALFDFARRLNAIQNASFYAQNGNAVLDDDPSDGGGFANGSKAIKNCSFYSFGTSPLANLAKGATPKFENCSFYNVTGVPADATAGTATAKTVTFADGTSEQFFAETLEEAKAYVESLGKVKSPAPYGKWIDGEYMLSVTPVAEVTYDASFNATVAIKDTAFAKVYFTTEEAQANGTTTMVYHTTDDFASYFTSENLGDMGDGAHTGALSYSAICANGTMTRITITIYADVKCDWFTFNNSAKAYTIRVNLDLNGYTLDLGNTSNQMNGLELWIYSSRPGAHFYSSASVAFTVNDIFTLNLGAADANGTYARNINFHCKNLLGNTYGGGANIYGGNYYQLPGASASGFVSIARRVTKINNANFFVLPGQSVFYDGAYAAHFYAASTGANPITGCSFYALGEGTSLLNSIAGVTPKFDSCSFYGVAAENVGSSGSVTLNGDANKIDANLPAVRTVTWADGSVEKFVAASLDEAKAFVETNAKAKAPAPYTVSKDGNLYLALTPKASVVYDDNFNATVVCEDGELTLVYYTVEETLTGKINYVTEPNIGAYLGWATHGGAKITLYQDMTSAPVTLTAERVPVDATSKAQAESAAYYLDLNGHKLTFTGSGLALDVKLANLYVYSSVAGGVIDASNHTLFRSNNDDYKWKDGKAYINDGSTDWSAYTGTTNIKPTNYTVWGEADKSGNKVYADNLTVYCEKINPDMYGNGAYIYGGTFVQADGVNPGCFLMMGRNGGNTSHVQVVENATFITNSTCAAAFNLGCTADRTFTNVTVISKNAAGAALTSFTELTNVATFVDCNFVNVNPYLGTDKVVYNGASYGTTAATFSVADFDISDAEQYLAQGTSEKTITVLGETYLLNGVIISDPATEALKLTLAQVGTQYYAIGATVPEKAPGAGADDPAYDYSAISAIDENRKVIAAGVASASLAYENQEDIAFTYQVDGGEVILVETLGSPELDGENFVSILNNLYNVKIVMYKDIILKSGVQFATLKDATDPKGKTVKVVDKSGYVDWDLNGCKVTVAAGATPIAMIAERESQGAQTNNVLHYAANASFKLYSSVAGGQYINETAYPIFGINKYSEPRVIGSYLLGTNDPAVNGGDNLTIVSNGPISMAYETQGNGPDGYTLYINGGTYVYNGTMAMFNVAGTVKVYNAKMLATGGALALIVNQFWAPTNLDVQNLTAVSAASGTKLIESGNYYQIVANGKTHTVSIKDVAFAGGTMNLSYNNVAFTVAGEIKAPDAAGLALAYPEAPAGKSAAYTSISIYGVAAKLLAYYENPTTVTVNNTVSGLIETWLVGSTYVADATNLIQEEGVWYYIANPELVGKVDGALVDDICAPENAGKTVVVEVGGAKEKLYFTVSLNGVLTYYCGDSAPAALPSKLAPADTQTYLITFYSDIVTNISGTTTIGGKAATIMVDLNGYTWKHNSTAGYAFVITSATSFIYSSVPGGVLDVSNANGIACTDGSGHAYFGEATKDGSEYGKNLTVYCKSIHAGKWYSTRGYIVGGTYIQPDGVTAPVFFGIDTSGNVPIVRNSTFIVNSLTSGFVRGVRGTFTNCVFIAKEATNIVASGDNNAGATFDGCYFYNVIPNIPEGTSVTYNDCFFSASSLIAQNGGVIAYTGESVTKTVNGVDYVFGAKLVASATLVTWGYGLEAEYWVAGATATHADIILDGAFVYAFAPVTVGADPVTATASLKGFVSGMLLTQLEAQNQIIFKLLISADSAIEYVEVGGELIPVSALAKVDGYYVLSDIYAPSKAADTIALSLNGAYNHEIELSLELYANAVLADESLAASHNLVYAMVEYVELMSGKNLAVDAPAGYVTKLPAVVASGNDVDLYFSICHDYELDIAIAGAPGTDFAVGFYSGLTWNCRLDETGAEKCGGIDLAELAYGMEVFYVAEGGETIRVIYTLGNYIYALENAEVVNAEAIAQLYALYNYAAYAAEYVAE